MGNGSEAEHIIATARQFAEGRIIEIETGVDDPTIGHKVLIAELPGNLSGGGTGRRLESLKPFLDAYRTRPERMAGTAEVTRIESFIDHVKRFRDEDSTVFADVEDRNAPKMLCVLDYNQSLRETEIEPAPQVEGATAKGILVTGPQPRFGEHRVLYRFPVSDKWKRWVETKHEGMGQLDFATFLEDAIMDVLDPNTTKSNTLTSFAEQLGIQLATPQALMTLSQGLTIHADQQVINAQALSSGQGQVSFKEVHNDAAGAPIKIPGGFGIAIPVFRGGAPYQIPVRLRYRVAGAAIKWTLQPQRTDEVWEDAITHAVNNVSTLTGCPLIFGKPEVAGRP